MVFNATINTISVISWRSVGWFIGGENGSTHKKPPTCRKSLTNFIEYASPLAGFELTMLLVLCSDLHW
jgi:hypothetical protein